MKKVLSAVITSVIAISSVQPILIEASTINNIKNDVLTTLSLDEKSDNAIEIDKELLKAINGCLGRGENEVITKEEALIVTKLDLSNSNITNIDGIKEFENLTELDLSKNNITNIDSLKNLKKLEKLSLSGNDISSGLGSLTDISTLKELDLSNTGLNDTNSSDVANGLNAVLSNKKENLEILDLSNNDLSKLDASNFSNQLGSLKVLNLNNNNINSLTLPDLPVLEELYLSNNNLDDTSVSVIGDLSSLKKLYLNNNAITNIDSLTSLSDLVDLSVANNKIDLPRSLSNKLTKLEALNLENCSLSNVDVLSYLINLKFLDLSNNNIENIRELTRLTNLVQIDLNKNKIQDISLLELLNNLEEIDLTTNYLNLNDEKTKNTIKTLEDRKVNVLYDGKSTSSDNENNNSSTTTPENNNQQNNNTSKPVVQITDISGHWAEQSIKDFIEKGYIGGYEDKTFRPNNSITRAEFVKIFNRYFGLTKKSGVVFSDTVNHWAKDDIDIAVTNGIANGVSETQFSPNALLTREQAAKMISNYLKLEDSNHDKISKFNDSTSISSWAKDSVEGVVENGYMGGYEDKTYRPKNNITRAEAVSTLSRLQNTNTNTNNTSQFQDKVLELVNQERAKVGVAPLSFDEKLNELANLKSKDMIDNKYFSHESPVYGSPFDMMKNNGVTYYSAGENIAYGQTTPEKVMDSWMNSEGHKKNILSSSFNYIGIGVQYDSNGVPYWTQMFIGR